MKKKRTFFLIVLCVMAMIGSLVPLGLRQYRYHRDLKIQESIFWEEFLYACNQSDNILLAQRKSFEVKKHSSARHAPVPYAESEVIILDILKGNKFSSGDIVKIKWAGDDPGGGYLFREWKKDLHREFCLVLIDSDDVLSDGFRFETIGDGFITIYPFQMEWKFMIKILESSNAEASKKLTSIMDQLSI